RDYYAMQSFLGGARRGKPEMKVRPPEPEFVTVAWKTDTARLAELRAERESLLAASRAAIEKGRETASDQKKLSGDEVKKRAENDAPGKLSKLDDAIKPVAVRLASQPP